MGKGPGKGKTNNPKGRTPGSKNKLTKPIVQEILDVARMLHKEGVGLAECARANPEWFFTHIFKNIIPKNVELTGLDGEPIQSKVEVIFVNSAHTG
jgi:hypothetical protein